MQVTRNKIECLLLTWHGTLICSTTDSAALCHKPLTERDSLTSACRLTVQTGLDLKFVRLLPLPDSDLPYESRTLGDGNAQKAPNGRGFTFLREAHYLCAPQRESKVTWDRKHAETWESFLPVPLELLIRLFDLSTRDWVDLANGDRIPGSAIAFKRDFKFSVGQLDIDLTRTYPTFFFPLGTSPHDKSADSVFVVGHGESVAAFASADKQAATGQARLWLRNAENAADDAAGPKHNSEPTVEITYPPELKSAEFLLYPPAFAHRDDRTFFLTKAWNGRQRFGYSTGKLSVRRARNCYLMLSRGLEGVVFDTFGVRRGYGYVTVCENLPKGFIKEGDRYFLDRQAIDQVPVLSGEHLIFYNGNLQNYYHWMVEALVALYMLRKVRPSNSKIVLPADLGGGSNLPYIESLKLLGFGDIDLSFSAAPIVQLEHATWTMSSGDPVEELPQHILLEFQSFVASTLAPGAAHTRVYVERERLRAVENAAEVREFLERAGFITVRLESLPMLEQVRLFASAEFVVAPHGAGLANLLFTPPSARVIEFTPNIQMRPFFWLISSRLGHEYAMLPCETDIPSFNGKLRVDMKKLAALLALLEKA
jgi:capsular polysaccharide biosynthesis protein